MVMIEHIYSSLSFIYLSRIIIVTLPFFNVIIPIKVRLTITPTKIWMHSSANEFGRLAQGVGGRIQGTNTIFFIHKYQVPVDWLGDVMYAKFVVELKPNKAEVHRTRLTVGGDKVHYPGDVGTPTADLILVKVHANSVISTPGAQYMTLDVKNFYLNTPMLRFEHVKIKIDDIPDEIIAEYNLREKHVWIAASWHISATVVGTTTKCTRILTKSSSSGPLDTRNSYNFVYARCG